MSTQVNPTAGLRLDLLGPTVEFLTLPQEANIDFCVLRGILPPGVSVPLHSHPDTEDFFVISGEVQAVRPKHAGLRMDCGKSGGLPPRAEWRTARLAKRFQRAYGLIHRHDQKTGTILSGGGQTDRGQSSTRHIRVFCAIPCAL
jgi:hypothetical protein